MKTPHANQLGTESGGITQPQQAPFAARVLAFCYAHRLLVLFLLAFGVRVAFILGFGPMAPPSQRADDRAYDHMADLLVTEHRYENAMYPPGYPMFLALNYALYGRSWFIVRIVQAGLGAVACLLVYRLGSKVFSERVGLVAGSLLAIYPGHVFFCWRLTAEGLYIVLLLWSLLVALSLVEDPRPLRSVFLGVLVGVIQLVKANLFLFPAMLMVWFAFSARGSGKRRTLCLALLIASFSATMLLQSLDNFLATGQAWAFPGNAGSALWLGNNPLASGSFYSDEDAPVVKAFIESHGYGERLKTTDRLEKQRIYRSLGWAWICENPWRFLALMPKKFDNAFGLFPRAQVFEGGHPSARVVHLLSYGLIAPFALGGMIAALRRWRACSLLYVVVLSYLPTVLVCFGTPRYTILIIPVLLVFASFALLTSYDYLAASGWLPPLGGTPEQHS